MVMKPYETALGPRQKDLTNAFMNDLRLTTTHTPKAAHEQKVYSAVSCLTRIEVCELIVSTQIVPYICAIYKKGKSFTKV